MWASHERLDYMLMNMLKTVDFPLSNYAEFWLMFKVM
jgi:hypothetical protein